MNKLNFVTFLNYIFSGVESAFEFYLELLEKNAEYQIKEKKMR